MYGTVVCKGFLRTLFLKDLANEKDMHCYSGSCVLQVPTLDFLNEKLGQYMAMYNDTVRGANLDLVFFKDAMTHLVKVNFVFPCGGTKSLAIDERGTNLSS